VHLDEVQEGGVRGRSHNDVPKLRKRRASKSVKPGAERLDLIKCRYRRMMNEQQRIKFEIDKEKKLGTWGREDDDAELTEKL